MTDSRFFISVPQNALSQEEFERLRTETIGRLQQRISAREQGSPADDAEEHWCADSSPDDDSSFPARTLAFGDAQRPELLRLIQNHLDRWLPRQLTKSIPTNAMIADELYDELCGFETLPVAAYRNWLIAVSQGIRQLVVTKANLQLRRLKELSAAETASRSAGATAASTSGLESDERTGPINLAGAMHSPFIVLCRHEALQRLEQDDPRLAELYQLASFAEVSPAVLTEIYVDQADEYAPRTVADIERLVGFAHQRLGEIEAH